jgi:hypothetical protein
LNWQFNNVADGTYNIDYDDGSFGAVGVLDNAATISALSPGLYKNLSITSRRLYFNDENPDVELKSPETPFHCCFIHFLSSKLYK